MTHTKTHEVEKMYSNTGIEVKNKCKSSQCIVTNPHPDWCNKCESLKYEYPPFTPEKQLELIKWLASKEYGYYSYGFLMNISDGTTWLRVGISCGEDLIYDTYSSDGDTLEEAIAKILRFMWNKLTDAEKAQIKEILE